MPDSRVVHVHEPDSALAKERSAAAAIVSRIRSGDAAAETELVKRYQRRLYFVVIRRVGDSERARDIVQDVLAIAIDKLRCQDLREPERLVGFLRGIADNTIKSEGRKRSRDPISLDIEAVAAIPDSSTLQYPAVAAEQIRTAIHAVLQELTVERDRELLMRFYVYDEDKDRICDELGIDRSHFSRVLFRAKGRFRKCLVDAGYGGLAEFEDDD